MNEPALNQKVLFVDDELKLLSAIYRQLRRDFQIETAAGGELGLESLSSKGPYAVVVSDMRMPQMDGAEFLSRVRRIAPQSTRLALTACLERELPAEEVFGILTKPCPINLLHASVHAAVEHHVLQALLARTGSAPVPEPRRIARAPFDPAETELEPHLPGLISGPRPLNGDPRLLPQLPDLEFDPWHIARAVRAAAAAEAADPEAPRLSALAGVAEKFFRLGHGREAERILRPVLWDFLQRCEADRRCLDRGIPRDVERAAEMGAESGAENEVELAGKLALRLATDTNAVPWIDYLFRIFTALSRPLPPELIEQLHDLLRRTPGVSRGGFLRYLAALRASRHEFGPGEHFLIRRIEGLEPLLSQ